MALSRREFLKGGPLVLAGLALEGLPSRKIEPGFYQVRGDETLGQLAAAMSAKGEWVVTPAMIAQSNGLGGTDGLNNQEIEMPLKDLMINHSSRLWLPAIPAKWKNPEDQWFRKADRYLGKEPASKVEKGIVFGGMSMSELRYEKVVLMGETAGDLQRAEVSMYGLANFDTQLHLILPGEKVEEASLLFGIDPKVARKVNRLEGDMQPEPYSIVVLPQIDPNAE